MPPSKRVYPGQRKPAKGISYLLFFLSAVVIFSGLASRGLNAPVIRAVATPTPISLEAAFDETAESREITLPGAVWYALQLGAFQEEQAAEDLAVQFRQRGAAGYVWQDERYRVLAAIYPSKLDAQNVRRQLLAQHAIETFLHEVSLRPLTIRVSGMKGQIDILEAAFLHVNELIGGLNALSILMDRQEVDVPEALERLRALQSQTDLVALRLEQRFAAPRDQTVQGLIGLFREYAAFVSRQAQDQSAVSLGQQIKYQAIQCLWHATNVLNAMEST